ncbi:hypothetical protein PF002_g16100 [Phytophthora fragariae]|uniref:Uncharacterized protein n=1 Tax=Phytophthora fragariae TaxID=53985 RepID=A0A6A3YIN2_9STRA|nr:hypothetical protein PF002_g16100 [Phytophthora fragariae]
MASRCCFHLVGALGLTPECCFLLQPLDRGRDRELRCAQWTKYDGCYRAVAHCVRTDHCDALNGPNAMDAIIPSSRSLRQNKSPSRSGRRKHCLCGDVLARGCWCTDR